MNPSPSEGTVAVVTGAGSGIGRAVAVALLDAGFRVALAGRREAALLESANGRASALVIPTDVSRPHEVDALFQRVSEEWGRVDVLFNNAGILGPAGMVDEISLADWNETVSVNLTGALLCAAAAVRIMKEQTPQGGRIINNGSISAHRPRPRSLAYSTTKHAVTGLTRSIALDGREYGITCGQIDIGNAATDLTAELSVGSGALQPDGTPPCRAVFPGERGRQGGAPHGATAAERQYRIAGHHRDGNAI